MHSVYVEEVSLIAQIYRNSQSIALISSQAITSEQFVPISIPQISVISTETNATKFSTLQKEGVFPVNKVLARGELNNNNNHSNNNDLRNLAKVWPQKFNFFSLQQIQPISEIVHLARPFPPESLQIWENHRRGELDQETNREGWRARVVLFTFNLLSYGRFAALPP